MDSSNRIVSPTFRFDKARFGRVATLFFLKRYWLVYAMAMLIGIALIVVQGQGMGLWVGIIFVVYPFTVPIRYSMVVTSKAASFLDREMHYEVEADSFLIKNDLGGITQAQMTSIRTYEVIQDTLVMLFGRAAFLMIPLEILGESDRETTLKRVKARGI